jgi:hypothetical protein
MECSVRARLRRGCVVEPCDLEPYPNQQNLEHQIGVILLKRHKLEDQYLITLFYFSNIVINMS